MTRPEGEPTHWQPLWELDGCLDDAQGHRECFLSSADTYGIIPADRVTIAPGPWTPKAGDRVRHRHGGEVTILTGEVLDGCLPCIWRDATEGDAYGVVAVSSIEGPA